MQHCIADGRKQNAIVPFFGYGFLPTLDTDTETPTRGFVLRLAVNCQKALSLTVNRLKRLIFSVNNQRTSNGLNISGPLAVSQSE